MIVVVADTSPLNYLCQINCEQTLPALYERILVPGAVIRELNQPRAPAIVRAWSQQLPQWLIVSGISSARASSASRMASRSPMSSPASEGSAGAQKLFELARQ